MTQAVQELLDSFDRLPESERLEALSELLKRTQAFEYPPLDDETLAQIADETWQMYDADEAANDWRRFRRFDSNDASFDYAQAT
jgi:TorA maturation chaperone TorD